MMKISRRTGLKLAASAFGAALVDASGIRFAYAQSKDVLVIGLDMSDMNSFDPGHQFAYSAPIVMMGAYEPLVTMEPGDYETVRPSLAKSWERVDDGQAWLFKLRDGIKFHTGNSLTAEDVKFTFERLINLKDNPAELAENIDSVDVVDPLTVKIVMKDKDQPLLNLLVGPTFVIADSKAIKEHGGTSSADADKTDQATQWLDSQSAGTGPYIIRQWERNSQVVLDRNDNYWRAPASFKRVVLKHIPESATQLLTLENSDIDAALNLTPPQLNDLEGKEGVKLIEGTSLDYVYMTLTSSSELNKALGNKKARQAIAAAINYEAMIEGLMAGYATRPASFIPNGVGGATAELTQQIGYQYDPDKAKKLLAEAGMPDGFSFDLYYGDASVAGTTYSLIAQTVKSDLAKVGITANLNPVDQSTARDKYRAGELPSVLTFWNPDGPEPWTWASASVQRVSKRVRWDVPPQVIELVTKAGSAKTTEEANKWYRQYMEALVDSANYLILFQPIYRVATQTTITGWRLTAAGWQVNLYDIKPSS